MAWTWTGRSKPQRKRLPWLRSADSDSHLGIRHARNRKIGKHGLNMQYNALPDLRSQEDALHHAHHQPCHNWPQNCLGTSGGQRSFTRLQKLWLCCTAQMYASTYMCPYLRPGLRSSIGQDESVFPVPGDVAVDRDTHASKKLEQKIPSEYSLLLCGRQF